MNLTVNRVIIPDGLRIPENISIFYKKSIYDSNYILAGTGYEINADGEIQGLQPEIDINIGESFVIMAENESCGYQYVQVQTIYAYCPVGYSMAPDMSYCFYEEVIMATPPTFGENTIAKTYDTYSTCGSWIYSPGYSLNGTGASVMIPLANLFWRNGDGPVGCVSSLLYSGPLNRCGLWSVTTTSNQTIGFSRCIDILVSKVYYIGIACDNLGIIKLDGEEIVHQDPAALDIQYGLTGNVATFVVWHIYPVFIPAGQHQVEMIGFNTFGVAAMGCEIYDNTAAEITAAEDYADLNLIFSSKDKIGEPVELGSGGLGFSCPTDYALRACTSPYECVKTVKIPPLIQI